MPGKAQSGATADRNVSLRIVFVTLDNHVSGAVERAEMELQRDMPGLTIGYHAAADWGRDSGALDAVRADIAKADIIIATMLFLEDHVSAILPALEARREHCDAMLGLMSAAEVVRLTRMGSYRMDAPSGGVVAMLKKLRGPAKPGGNAGEKQMKMLRRLPKILKFMPGTAQDVRHYFLTMQYWLAGSDENVVNMLRGLVDRYAAGPRATLKGRTPALPPREYPEVGVYHAALADRMAEDTVVLPRQAAAKGTVGVLLLRSYVLGKDTGHYDGAIAALEAQGLNVVPAFASGLDSRPAIAKFFQRDGIATIDALINLTGFSLVGGPAYNDAKAAEEVLAGLDIPYIAAHPVEFQSLEQWGEGKQGLLPLEATLMVAIPELDGAVMPSVFGGRSNGSGKACKGCARGCIFTAPDAVRAMQSCPERAEALAGRVARMVDLRRAERAKRKLAIVLFNFPPNAGATGTAAHLAVYESLHATLQRLSDEGYAVDVPVSVDALRDSILKGNSDRFGSDANVAVRISTDDHVTNEPYLRAIEAQWGPAPGKIQSDGWSIHVLGKQFGNVFVGIQPTFGFEGDPMRLLYDGDFAPTHAFSAFYRWIREDFGANAVLHFGTHGALEFMPGKQTGMSGACWPDRLIGSLPNFYLYAANNPSEGILAKRRSGATLVSYLTPPLAEAGLYKGFADLKALTERWRGLPEGESDIRSQLEVMIREAAAELDIDSADLPTLVASLYELERELIPFGLHVLGKPLEAAEHEAFLNAMCDADPAADRAVLSAKLASNDELGGLIHALDGCYVRPGPGGDVLHNAEVMPTGRNTHGFDPFRLPSRFATTTGALQAEALLERHIASGEPMPESIAMVLWGTDNLKSEGAQIAQVMHLFGATARFDSYGRLAGAVLLPLAELGRPRIDVIATLSGVFRDLLPLQTRMMAEAAWLAASADEPLEQNFVRKHALAYAEKMGCDLETAALRVFSNEEGAYGAQVNVMIDDGAWTDPDDLAEAFEKRKGFAYGRSGTPVQRRDLLETALADVAFTYQNLDSVELGVTDIDQYVDALGGVSRSVARARGGKAAPVYIVDATQGAAKVRTLGEQIDLETRSRMLNPKWYEGLLKHGYEGVRQIEGHVTTTMGWSATTGEVRPWVYQQISETFVLDDAMRTRLATLNPKASARVAERLLEACDRRLWEPDAATLAALRAAADDIEDRLEGLVAAE